MMKRRDFIALLAGATTWPLTARAQRPALPVVALFNSATIDASAPPAAAFRKGLAETGYTEGENVTIEYHGLEGRFERLPGVLDDVIRRGVAVIATPGSNPASLAAKAATGSIPVVFGVGADPVELGLVASLARPGGNVTGFNWFSQEVAAKRLGLLHELLPLATRVAVLVNPGNGPTAEITLREVRKVAPTLGLQIQALSAATIGEIDAAFASLAREHADALFVASDAFFNRRRGQFATLAARDRIPASYSVRDHVEAGGLMSYGADIYDIIRLAGVYTGRILKGARPADLPVLQSTKFELAINLQTARALGLAVPPSLLALADEVIE